jgi:hypothetical protein
MSIPPDVIRLFATKAIDALGHLQVGETKEDADYEDLRERLGKFFKALPGRLDSPEVIAEAERFSGELNTLNLSKMTKDHVARSRANQVALAGYLMRTHYSAYLAGKFSGSCRIGSLYRAWMHAIAGEGATHVMTFLMDINPEGLDHEMAYMRKVLLNGSKLDSMRFCELAVQADPRCIIARHNLSKIELLLGLDFGVACDRMLSIKSPSFEHASHLEVTWHANHFDEFMREGRLRGIIAAGDERKLLEVELNYKRNMEDALAIQRRWEREREQGVASNRSPAMVATLTIGLLLVMVLASASAHGQEMHFHALHSIQGALGAHADLVNHAATTVGGANILDPSASTIGGAQILSPESVRMLFASTIGGA